MKYTAKYMAAAQRRRGKALDRQAFRAYQQMIRCFGGFLTVAEVRALREGTGCAG